MFRFSVKSLLWLPIAIAAMLLIFAYDNTLAVLGGWLLLEATAMAYFFLRCSKPIIAEKNEREKRPD